MIEKVAVTKNREVIVYSELWHAAGCTLTKAQQEEDGSASQNLSSIILFVFSIEAYLNHTGKKLIPLEKWQIQERLCIPDKLHFLCNFLGVILEKNKRPYQTFRQAVKFRNNLAHGKTTTLKPEVELKKNNEYLDESLGKRPMTDWEEKVQNSDFALRLREDTEKLLVMLHTARPEINTQDLSAKEALFSSGFSSFKAEIKHS